MGKGNRLVKVFKVIRLILFILMVLLVSAMMIPVVDVIADGEAQTLTLRPVGVGTQTQITSQFPASGDHWDKVDESVPDNNTSYIYSSSVTIKVDAFELPDHTFEIGVITNVKVYAVAKDTNVNGRSALGLKIDGTVYRTGEQLPSDDVWTALTPYESATNPATSDNWTWADIDAMEVIVYQRYSVTVSTVYTTQTYVEVTFYCDPPDNPSALLLTDLGGSSVSANWPSVAGAMTYILRYKRNEYPLNYTDGELAYSGNMTEVNISGLALELSRYNFSLWAENPAGVSGRSDSFIGGEDVKDIAIMYAPLITGLALLMINFFMRSTLVYIVCILMFFGVVLVPEFNDTWLQAGAVVMMIACALAGFFNFKKKVGA